MSVEFNNGLILGLYLKGSIGGGGTSTEGNVEISSMQSYPTQLSINYTNELSECRYIYSIIEDAITYTEIHNRFRIVLVPKNGIYNQL